MSQVPLHLSQGQGVNVPGLARVVPGIGFTGPGTSIDVPGLVMTCPRDRDSKTWDRIVMSLV